MADIAPARPSVHRRDIEAHRDRWSPWDRIALDDPRTHQVLDRVLLVR